VDLTGVNEEDGQAVREVNTIGEVEDVVHIIDSKQYFFESGILYVSLKRRQLRLSMLKYVFLSQSCKTIYQTFLNLRLILKKITRVMERHGILI
jgi:hypothetical protein